MNTTIAQQIANEGGVEAYLHAQQHKSLLRFLTCGSVDDGKSTLIGRLLHDTRQIYEDQLSSLHNDSKRHGTQGEKLDLALLVDGLQAEREQGITIDVAYRYFSTEKRKFIIADTPGHEQYTRNMATGASTCDLAILLMDARKGVLDQTRRHSFISTLLGIKNLVVAVNKMDLVDFSEETFNRIREEYLTFAEQLPGDVDIRFVPLSALKGTTSRPRAPACRGTAARRCWKCWKPLKFVAWWKISRCVSRSSLLTGPTSISAVSPGPWPPAA
jgi:sulfate adenylyltransferase subunit 1